MKFLKILGVIVLILILVAVGAVAYVSYGLPTVGDAPALTVEVTPDRVQRGEHLFNDVMMCVACHSKRDYSKYMAPIIPGTIGAGGEEWTHENGFTGEMIAPNITPHVMKDWTDGEIYRAITMGVDKDGNALFPIMPYHQYGKLQDEDIYDVIAYMRTLPKRESNFPETELDFPLNLIVNTIPARVENKLARPNPQNKLAYGKYLVTAAACIDCHTPQKDGQFLMDQYMGGGFDFHLPNGIVVTSANITPHKEFGIGSWEVNRFLERFHAYRDSNFTTHQVKEGEFNSIMPWLQYANLSDEELEAIYTYLQSLDPVANQIEKHHIATREM